MMLMTDDELRDIAAALHDPDCMILAESPSGRGVTIRQGPRFEETRRAVVMAEWIEPGATPADYEWLQKLVNSLLIAAGLQPTEKPEVFRTHEERNRRLRDILGGGIG